MSGAPLPAGPALAHRAVIRHFAAHAATAPERAVGFQPNGRLERRLFGRMRDFGVIGEASPGQFYINADRLAAFRASIRRRAVRVAVMASVLAAGVVTIVT